LIDTAEAQIREATEGRDRQKQREEQTEITL
jgi:hypothetical protein